MSIESYKTCTHQNMQGFEVRYMDENKRMSMSGASRALINSVTIEERTRLIATGVVDVVNFSEESVELDTALGTLHIRGQGLRMRGLSVDSGDFVVEGDIEGVLYQETARKKSGSFFGGLFR